MKVSFASLFVVLSFMITACNEDSSRIESHSLPQEPQVRLDLLGPADLFQRKAVSSDSNGQNLLIHFFKTMGSNQYLKKGSVLYGVELETPRTSDILFSYLENKVSGVGGHGHPGGFSTYLFEIDEDGSWELESQGYECLISTNQCKVNFDLGVASGGIDHVQGELVWVDRKDSLSLSPVSYEFNLVDRGPSILTSFEGRLVVQDEVFGTGEIEYEIYARIYNGSENLFVAVLKPGDHINEDLTEFAAYADVFPHMNERGLAVQQLIPLTLHSMLQHRLHSMLEQNR
tara:strand:- start:1884 stop:2744 length:861 start_codon:yes stop_codon:yes gene_type:complete